MELVDNSEDKGEAERVLRNRGVRMFMRHYKGSAFVELTKQLQPWPYLALVVVGTCEMLARADLGVLQGPLSDSRSFVLFSLPTKGPILSNKYMFSLHATFVMEHGGINRTDCNREECFLSLDKSIQLSTWTYKF